MTRYNISENQRKFKFVPVANRWPVLIFCLLVLAIISKAAWNAYLEKKRSDEAFSSASFELAELEKRHQFVSSSLERLSTEEGVRSKLREKFTVAAPGEQVAIIVESEGGDSSSKNKNIWQKIKDFFSSLVQK